MGKGYNNFMCKKPFHPGSRENIKRVWMAEQRTEDEKKKQEELRLQYEKEQELYNNRLLVSTESKEKLSLNFMYEAPKGVKEKVKEDDEPEYKFEWQRHAPRESFAKNNMDIRDQPFGIQVRNVRCIKCHKWGHLNTDRECPEFNQSVTLLPGGSKLNQDELMQAMQEDGLALKKTLSGEKFDPREVIRQKQEEDPEVLFLRSLSKKQKEKLLRKLNRLSGVPNKKAEKKHKTSKKSKRSRKHNSSESNSESSDDHSKKLKSHRHHSKKHKSRKNRSDSESRSRSSSLSPKRSLPRKDVIKCEKNGEVKEHGMNEVSRNKSYGAQLKRSVSRSPRRSYSPKRGKHDNKSKLDNKMESENRGDQKLKQRHRSSSRSRSRSSSSSPKRSLPRKDVIKCERNDEVKKHGVNDVSRNKSSYGLQVKRSVSRSPRRSYSPKRVKHDNTSKLDNKVESDNRGDQKPQRRHRSSSGSRSRSRSSSLSPKRCLPRKDVIKCERNDEVKKHGVNEVSRNKSYGSQAKRSVSRSPRRSYSPKRGKYDNKSKLDNKVESPNRGDQKPQQRNRSGSRSRSRSITYRKRSPERRRSPRRERVYRRRSSRSKSTDSDRRKPKRSRSRSYSPKRRYNRDRHDYRRRNR